MKNKEEAKKDFIVMTQKSWTYERMTEEEKIRFDELFSENSVNAALKGSYLIRWRILQAIFSAYLKGIGYTGWQWRYEK